MVGNVLVIPHVLKAESPEGLSRAMLLNNLKDGKQYVYSNITYDGSNWYAFFLKEADRKGLLIETVNKKKGGNK